MEYKIGDIVKIADEKGLIHRNEMIKISKIGKNFSGNPLVMGEGDAVLGTPFEMVRSTTTIKFGS